MSDSEKLFLLALESATPAQLEAMLAIAEEKGVSLAALIEEALDRQLTKEFDQWDQGD
jgi:hypothetical protein